MRKRFQKPKGTSDLLPQDTIKWQYLEEIARRVFKKYQYNEIRTPLFESYDVFSRAVGETSDIVSKEMYDFYDKGNRHIALRPEGTAPVVRAFVENKLFAPEVIKPYKVYYLGSMFRYERPQSGRQREFHQIGIEAFGSNNPAVDTEAIAMLMELFTTLGLQDLRLVINSLGDPESRANYRQALINFLEPVQDQLSSDSKRRFRENPLRVLDSKDEQDQKVVSLAPSILDYLNEESAKFFEQIQVMLKELDIKYEIDSKMVRGLDYYNHTIFEVISDSLGGSQNTIAGGGRYNGLVEYFGGDKTPSFGFAFGVERLLLAMTSAEVAFPGSVDLDVYVVTLGEVANLTSLKIVQAIRNANLAVERDFLDRKAKVQFKTADKLKAKYIVTVGEQEVIEGKVKFKNSATREEFTVALEQIYEDFTKAYEKFK